MPQPTRGLVIGKFMPPHRGHQFLIESARQRVDELTVIVFTKSYEPIPGDIRYAWMRRLFPDLQVLRIHDDYPTDFGNPDLWRLRIDMIRDVYPDGPDFVFSSEPYGDELARRLGAQAIVVDAGREQVPVSATMIREDPYRYWEFIPPYVRPHYAKKVVVLGAQCRNARSLSADLALNFSTTRVEDRTCSEDLEPYRQLRSELDLKACIAEQALAEGMAAESSNRVVICDTSPLLLALRYASRAGWCSDATTQLAAQRADYLHLVARGTDEVRDLPVAWIVFQLRSRELRVVELSGSYEEQLRAAITEVESLLGRAESLR